MKDEDKEIAPLIKSYILIDQIESEKNINNSLYELKKMCKMNGDEFLKNVNLISFNHTDFKNVGTKEKEVESFFILNFLEFLENENFVKIFTDLLMDAKKDNEINEIYNCLNKKFNLNIEEQIKLILSFIESRIDKYNEDANLLFLEKCKEIYEKKIFAQIKNNIIIEKIINILFNILKIKNRQENNKEDYTEQNCIGEENIKLYIQSFSHYNEQLKNSGSNKDKAVDRPLKNEEIGSFESNFKVNYTKRGIEIEKLLYELGPFMANQKINLLSIPYIDAKLDLSRMNEFIIYILNNQEIKLTKELKYLNKKFLDAMNIDKECINKLDSLPANQIITWDLESIYELFKNSFDNIDKKKLLISLDNLFFKVDNKAKFDFFCDILTKFHFFGDYNNNNNYNISDIQTFFDNFIFMKWKNVSNQLKFLELLITNKEISDNSIFSLKNYLGQKTKKDIELKAYIISKNHFLIENWRNVKLVETLLLISEEDNYAPVRSIFDWALKNIPEIIVMSLLVVKVDYNENILMKELLLEILTSILNDKSPRLNFIDEIWQTNKDIVIFTLYKSWEKNPDLMNLSLIFDLANTELKDSLLPLVNSKYHNFSVHLGLLASKRDYLHIEQWLKKSIEKYGDDFICSLLDYLKLNIIQPCNNNSSPNENNKASTLEKAQLSLESLSIILNTLNSYNTQNENDNNESKDKISPKIKKEIGEINKKIFDIYDEIQDQQINSEEIQKEVSQLLRSMFQEKITIDKIVSMLSKYKSSNDKRQNELFSCLIHGILDEYRFYGQYPQNELKKISELFGKIINNKLLDGTIETLALKYILKGIKTGSGLLYFFGINALTQFIGKISHWPTYMKTLLDLDQIKQNKKIYVLLQQESEKFTKKTISEKSTETFEKLIPSISISHTHSENKSIEENSNKNINNENVCYTNKSFKSKESKDSKETENVNKLKNKLTGVTKSYIDNDYQNNDENKIELPMDEVINKTKLIFETLNKSNILEKSLEIRKLLGDDEKLIRWFSYYFMTTKINHWKNIPFRVFNELFKEINNSKLSKYILKDTINYIQELLSLDCLYIDDKCKNLLKNLGTWLGFNTLSKNKPIWAKDIDFKELISNSYKKGELNTIIPFTCRVFSFISKTKIFNANNPWINSILCLLKEIYYKSALCLALKEEIRNFFENVKVDMNSISNNTKVLNKIDRLESKNHDFPDSQKYQINIDINELTKKISSLNDYINNLLNILSNDKNKVRGFYYNNSYNDYNNLNENDNPNASSNPNYKIIEHQKEIISILSNIMYQSILDAIPDLITLFVYNPISSAIAIVNKDFTFESDLNKYQTALYNILQSILKSFSIIGSHDKLKSNIDSNLEKYYKAKQLEKETINKIKDLPNSEYINIGLEYIQKFIMNEAKNRLNLNKKVLEEIDKRRHGNLNLLENDFYEEYIKIKNKIPDILKPNEFCMKDNEYKVYENFNMNGYKFYEEDSDKSSFLNIVYRILKEVIDKADPGQNKVSIYKNYDLCMKNIQNISKKNSFNNNNFEEDQQLVCLKKIIVNSKINQIDICSQLALNTFKYIMDSIKINNLLLLNVYLYILRGWVKMNNKIVDKISIFLFEYDVDIFTKFKYELHLNLMKQKVINNNIYENYMIKLLIENSTNNTIIQKLLNHLINNNSNSPKSPFNKIKSYFYDKNSKNFYLLFNEKSSILKSLTNNYNYFININNEIDENNEDKIQIKFKYSLYFENIIREFYKFYYSSEVIFDKNEQLPSSDEILNCTESLCELCLNNIYNENYKNFINFYYPENFAIFIYYNIVNFKKNNIELYNNILEKIVNYFHQDYMKNQLNFNQKKYHKFFINLISLIINNPNSKEKKTNIYLNEEYMLIICDIFKLLSPMNYQGFIIAWLDLISYNDFIKCFLDDSLNKDNKEKYEKYLALLTELLSYLNFIKNQSINKYYYKVILDSIYKLFYYLANTYQAFIASYQFILFSYLSLSSKVEDEDNNYFLQLKNIISSSIPPSLSTEKNGNKTLYDENCLNIKLLKENKISNKVICLLFREKDNNYNTEEMELSKMVEKYINEKSEENILEQILTYLSNIKDEKELTEIYNGLMLCWCFKRNNCINGKEIKEKKLFYNFYYFLLCNLDEIQKKFLIDSILNSLRFSCEQTISCSILFIELFVNLENEDIEKQLMINILERALYKPIPWGIKNTLNSLFDDERFIKMEKKYIEQNIEIVNFIKSISDNKKKK